jgi:transcriptional regulator with XRE-family HTH domain
MKCPYCNGSGELAATMGAMIRQSREEKGLTQLEVANGAGLSRTQITNIELDRTDVPTKTLMRIAQALGVRAGDLLP